MIPFWGGKVVQNGDANLFFSNKKCTLIKKIQSVWCLKHALYLSLSNYKTVIPNILVVWAKNCRNYCSEPPHSRAFNQFKRAKFTFSKFYCR